MMLSKRATVALFTIAIASSLLLPNISVGSAFAAKKKMYKEDDDFSIGSLKPSSVNAADLDEDKDDDDDSAAKEKNSKSKCDRAPTLAEQRECYRLACNDYD
jgi:hypothetical protein